MKDIVTTTEVRELLISLADFYEEKKEELSSYDAVIGDGDHGMTVWTKSHGSYGRSYRTFIREYFYGAWENMHGEKRNWAERVYRWI